MNKNSENYKNTYSALRPSDEAIERIFEMTTDKKKTGLRLTYRRIAAVVLAFVLIIGGGFGIEILTKNDSNKNEMLVSNGKKNDNYFVMSVYAHFGIYLSRTTYTQANEGIGVSYGEMVPGDVINYGFHTSIYIGNGMIVHAADESLGIITGNNPAFEPIVTIRRFIY